MRADPEPLGDVADVIRRRDAVFLGRSPAFDDLCRRVEAALEVASEEMSACRQASFGAFKLGIPATAVSSGESRLRAGELTVREVQWVIVAEAAG
jgi:hypothetical protein